MLDIVLFLIFAVGVPWTVWLIFGLGSGVTVVAMLAPGIAAAALMLTISPLRLAHSPLVRFGPPH
jgi:hypothetical protein